MRPLTNIIPFPRPVASNAHGRGSSSSRLDTSNEVSSHTGASGSDVPPDAENTSGEMIPLRAMLLSPMSPAAKPHSTSSGSPSSSTGAMSPRRSSDCGASMPQSPLMSPWKLQYQMDQRRRHSSHQLREGVRGEGRSPSPGPRRGAPRGAPTGRPVENPT